MIFRAFITEGEKLFLEVFLPLRPFNKKDNKTSISDIELMAEKY